MRCVTAAILGLMLCAPLAAAEEAGAPADFWSGMKAVIGRHLGRPYVWGSSGLRSFDCSGFVWRVLTENGMLIKRTTARKLYMSLPATGEAGRWGAGNIVFFDNLKHCGIVESRAKFYHAQLHKGTNLSSFDPFWRPKVCGVRRVRR